MTGQTQTRTEIQRLLDRSVTGTDMYMIFNPSEHDRIAHIRHRILARLERIAAQMDDQHIRGEMFRLIGRLEVMYWGVCPQNLLKALPQ